MTTQLHQHRAQVAAISNTSSMMLRIPTRCSFLIATRGYLHVMRPLFSHIKITKRRDGAVALRNFQSKAFLVRLIAPQALPDRLFLGEQLGPFRIFNRLLGATHGSEPKVTS